MTIPELTESSNKALKRVPTDVIVVLTVILASSAAFGLGYLTGQGNAPTAENEGFWIEDVSAAAPAAAIVAPAVRAVQAPKIEVVAPGTPVAPSTGKYVASKNGTKYYLPTCSGAKRIKEENKVWFATVEEAQAAGLGPAANCPGL